MRKIEILKHYGNMVVILVFLMLFNACEKNKYELLNATAAGIWTFYDTSTGLPSNQVRDIKLDSKDNLWFTFPGYGTGKYDNNTWTYYKTTNSPILNNGVICLASVPDGGVIFGTSNGLSILAPNNVWTSYLDPSTSMYINTVKVASNGWIWVGTENQGFYINNGSGFTKNLTDQYKNVNVIEEGIKGNIYLGTDNGIIKWDGANYSYLTTSDGLPNNKVTSLHFDSKERLWIGTNGGNTVSWTDRSGMHQLNLMTGSDSTFVKSIWEDRKGDIWFATYNNGLIRYDGVIPHTIKKGLNAFPENRVNCIGEDKYGNLWFGLYSKGIAKYTLPVDFK